MVTERLNQETDFDVLSDILETLRFRGSIFFSSELAAPWGMSLPQMGIPRFHIALSGDFFVGTEAHHSVHVGESEILMLPNGDSHWIADHPGRELVPSARAGKACELGDPLFQYGEISHRLLCGMVRFDEGARHPILEALPEIMHFPALEPNGSIWSTVSLIDDEMRNRQSTNSRIADRLTEVLFLKLLNSYISHHDEKQSFLAALRDRRVYRALTLIHKAPEFDWTLSSLGKKVGMSRATLVRRFQEIVGIAPMAYIMDWRLMKAHELIKHTMQPLEQIAHATGFTSARTLSRAFKRHYGCTPRELRQSQHDG
ncbi:MAG: AraC family transcriptional regulator [Chromatiaceae bacterium]